MVSVQIANKQTPLFTPKLCKLSVSMLEGSDKGSFLERMQRDALKKEHMAEKLRLLRESNDRDCTFRPEITRKSAEKPSRSVVEMSRGDMLRRETNQRLLKLRVEKERFSDFTFRPRVNNESPHHHRVQSKLRIATNPDTYIERLHKEAKRKADVASRVVQAREMAEVAECTFKPKLHDCPAFIKRIARSLALTRSYSKEISVEEGEEANRRPEWR